MSSSVGLLEFYAAEAGEYVARLDALLASAGPTGPDAAALLRHARALRGSSTMARQDSIARVARALERVFHALRDGTLRWDAALANRLREANGGVSELVRSVRTWSSANEVRATTSATELERLAAGIEARGDAPMGVEQVIPIGELFPNEPGPHVLYAAPNPAAGAAMEADGVVFVDTLLYRGRSALARAIATRDEIRQRDGAPPDDVLAELFDLLDLAAAE